MNTSIVKTNNLSDYAGDVVIKLLIAIFSVICSFFSDWLSQVLANLMNIEKTSSWTLVFILVLAVISTLFLKVLVDKEFIKDEHASDKITFLGNSFSMILLIRVFSPCWADCLTCETQGPTAPFLKSGVALIPFLLSAGISYQAKSIKSEANHQWLSFNNRYDHKRIIAKVISEQIKKQGDKISEDEIIAFYKTNRIPFNNINQIREQISLFIIDVQSKGGIPYNSDFRFMVELYAQKNGHWYIRLWKDKINPE